MSRRTVLAAATAAATAASAPGVANAAIPAAGRQAPGVYRYKVGAFEVTAITDGVARRPLDDSLVRNAPIERVREALADAFLAEDGKVPISFTAVVVNTGARLILIDAGTGGFLAPTAGQLYENLAAAGVDQRAIDTVLVSHFHADHIGGVRLKDGSLAFPNAEVVVPDAEWAFWMDDGQMSRAPEALQPAFKMARRVFGPMTKEVRRFQRDAEVAPGIVAIPAPGHTPGHTAFRLSSNSQDLIIWSDTTNHPALFVRHPGWHAVFDIDPDLAETTRRRMLDMVAADQSLVAGYHFPFPAVGHIARRGTDYDFVPVMWNPAL
ncbi:MBL fold metallo-hydrolase [Hansschlegelia plantiphila]|uniref:MBL fold metallo-hydrolase n=1 Tax=Hansschlegelia plantiphila TaxID=374655 RepID=UPI0028524D5E|nr:MBL fold metallo-hydrolase [Hansschlegelia plantiphila]